MNQQQATLPFNNKPQATFANFLGNEAVVSALQNNDTLSQFTYLTGADHVGKTHLLHALDSRLQAQGVVSMALDSAAIKGLDVEVLFPPGLHFLLLDDVDVLAGDEVAEVTLFNVFNHCRNNRIKLLVTAAVHPKSTVWQLPDLRSRLNSGLTLVVDSLQGNEALNCLAGQFESAGIPLDETVLSYLKTHMNTRYTELYQLFLTVAEISLKLKRKVTVPLIKQAMQDIPS